VRQSNRRPWCEKTWKGNQRPTSGAG
jgi:hypothetical protein